MTPERLSYAVRDRLRLAPVSSGRVREPGQEIPYRPFHRLGRMHGPSDQTVNGILVNVVIGIYRRLELLSLDLPDRLELDIGYSVLKYNLLDVACYELPRSGLAFFTRHEEVRAVPCGRIEEQAL